MEILCKDQQIINADNAKEWELQYSIEICITKNFPSKYS